MPNTALISTDPIVARSFYLDFPKLTGFILQSVSGLQVSLDVVQTSQNGKDGRQQHIKTLGGGLNVPEVSVVRMAPQDAKGDKLWKWFLEIRDKGFSGRTDKRQDGSIILYDAGAKEVGRFNVFGCWPSAINTDDLSTDSNEPMKETITFQCERIERAK